MRLMFNHYGSKATDFDVPVAMVNYERARQHFDKLEDFEVCFVDGELGSLQEQVE